MIFHPRTPLIVGSLAILALAAFLAWEEPSPGELAAPHAQVPELGSRKGCEQCHRPAGLTEGCLSCHALIRDQLSEKRGFHYYLAQRGQKKCQACHPDHLGRDFDLVGRLAWKGDSNHFSHAYVKFELHGRHDSLECPACHREDSSTPVRLPGFDQFPRSRTFLGLSQECRSCHEDVHQGRFAADCRHCHDQNQWRPAPGFDHSEFYTLVGAHAKAACDRCHVPSPRPTPTKATEPADLVAKAVTFAEVRGKTCAQCHESVHRAPLGQDCERCHAASAADWRHELQPFSASDHALTGFALSPPHDHVGCEKCHPADRPFAERYPDPNAPGYLRRETTCQGCHADVHQGQFAERYQGCLDCHAKERFQPSTFGLERHAQYFALKGAHVAVACLKCHPVEQPGAPRRFVGTDTACKACHADPHGGQFANELAKGDCSDCHGTSVETFRIPDFDHAQRTGYALQGKHAKAKCSQCHLPQPAGAADAVIQYRGTPTACAACHLDIHRGQFREGDSTRCERCHGSTDDWHATQFDHNDPAVFPLTGAHAKVRCEDCHPRVPLPDGSTLVQYKPLGKECRDCHVLPTP